MGLYPAWIYSLIQVILETWVMALCTLLQAAIAIPMISLWNPSISNSATFLSMFAVFCVSGVVGNSIVLVGSLLPMINCISVAAYYIIPSHTY